MAELLLQLARRTVGLEHSPRFPIAPSRTSLQRDAAVGARVGREKDDGHAAAPDLALDLVRADAVEDGSWPRRAPGSDAGVGAGRGLLMNQLSRENVGRHGSPGAADAFRPAP